MTLCVQPGIFSPALAPARSEFVHDGANPADNRIGTGHHDQVVVLGLAEKMFDGRIDVGDCVGNATCVANSCSQRFGIDPACRRSCAGDDQLVLMHPQGSADVDGNATILHTEQQKAATAVREVVGEGLGECHCAGDVVRGVEKDHG